MAQPAAQKGVFARAWQSCKDCFSSAPPGEPTPPQARIVNGLSVCPDINPRMELPAGSNYINPHGFTGRLRFMGAVAGTLIGVTVTAVGLAASQENVVLPGSKNMQYQGEISEKHRGEQQGAK